MRKEAAICAKCQIKRSCHSSLKPEILKENGTTRPIPDNYTHINVATCRNYTCEIEGVPAAWHAYRSGSFRQFPAFIGKEIIALRATPFGSDDKQTEHGSWRIVSDTGQILSIQDGIYYHTGRMISLPPGSDHIR